MTSRRSRRPAGRRSSLLVASGSALLVLVGCGGSSSDAPPAGALGTARTASSGVSAAVSLDLAHGVPSGWERRQATVEHGAGEPSSWVRLDAIGTPTYVSLPPAAVPSAMHHYRFSGRFRVRTRQTSQTVGLATVENSAGEHHADLFVDRTSGRCRVDLFSEDTALSRRRCDDGAWHRVTLSGDFGSDTYTLSWTLDGMALPAISSRAQPPATVHRLWLGDATPGKTNITNWSGVSLELSSS